MAIDWTTVERAIRSWVATATGLNVIWTQQDGDRPAPPYVALRIMAVRQVGHDWLNVEDAAAPVSGAEIEHKVRGQREVTMSVQAFAGPATGGGSPVAALEAARAAFMKPTVRAALVAAGVGISKFGPVTSLDAILGASTFEPRSVVDVTFFLASEVSEVGTYIEHVEVSDESDAFDVEFTVDL